jgi:hypothetical protein
LEVKNLILEMSPILALIGLGTPISVLVMFVPTLIELKRPKDAGPRLIISDLVPIGPRNTSTTYILNDIERNPVTETRLSALFQNTFGYIYNLDD